MSNSASFTVTAKSRLPRLGSEYDPEQHRYHDSHLNPDWAVLEMNAFPGIEVVERIPIPDKDGSLPNKPGDPTSPGDPNHPVLPKGLDITGGPTVIEITRLKVPDNAVSYDWTINQVDGDFEAGKSNSIKREHGWPVEDGNPFAWSVRVPEPGKYRIGLTLRRESGNEPSHSKTFQTRNFFVVSLGDSYAAGEGNPDHPGKIVEFDVDFEWWEAVMPGYVVLKAAKDYLKTKLLSNFTSISTAIKWEPEMDPEPVWLEPKAHRSLRSGPAKAARLLEDTEAGDLISFVSYARSGAEIVDGMFGPRTRNGKSIDEWSGNIGELEELRRDLQRMRDQIGDRPIDALILSIGGNDAGFVGRMTDLVVADIWHWGDKQIEEVRNKVQKALDKLSDNFGKLAKEIDKLNVRRVYITEYPTAHFERILDNGRIEVRKGCGIFSGLDMDMEKKDARLMKMAAEQLNDLIRDEAVEHGWVYVGGVADGFRGHGYCMGEDGFFRTAEGSLALQGDIYGTMHPTEDGNNVYAKQIKAALQKHMIDGKPFDPPAEKELSLLRALQRENINKRPVSVNALREQFDPLVEDSLRSLIKSL